MLHQAKLNEWASRFIEQKASGLSVSEWCRQNNQSRYKFFYWKRLLKEEAALQVLPDIVPLSVPSVSPQLQPDSTFPTTSELGSATCASCATFTSNLCARLYINGICIELDSSANETFIKNIIKAVRHA
jgi:hypothetical protein